ncbi:ArdC family protein [Pedobacter sp. Leaf250]|uniref:ArdC family protein n=1 Tax=Pedobacter sp. Leaf250 TaxID=2876559 RepID=UPI001E3CDD8F|nr:zincin-like metallopeptidase domain-containing protein [Pedobacter sp. Leaf250]
MENKNLPLHIQVANSLIEQLKKGTVPWRKPWNGDGIPLPMLPYNVQSGNRYKGINAMNLMLSGREDPRWLTFKQAEAIDAKINRGEKGTLIQFIKTHHQKSLRDDKGKIIYDEIGQPLIEKTQLNKPIVSSAWVFNAEQTTGLPELFNDIPKKITWDPIERAESLLLASGADISHQYIDNAFYNIRYDSITLPERGQFANAQGYYATALHELAHWTGHPDRLDRATLMNSGMIAYSKEELRAEIASMFIGSELGIGHDTGQHAAYVESWVSILEDTPFEIHSAAMDAEKIFDFLMNIERKREIEASPDLEVSFFEQRPKNFLSTGDQISYRDSIYRVEGHLKQGRLRIEQLPSGLHFTLANSDPLYRSLLDQKLGLSLDLPTHLGKNNNSLTNKR